MQQPTFEYREKERQWAQKWMSETPTNVLRLARAKLADMLESAPPEVAEYVRLRGELVHAELERRESLSGFGKLGSSFMVQLKNVYADSKYLTGLTTWKDVPGLPVS